MYAWSVQQRILCCRKFPDCVSFFIKRRSRNKNKKTYDKAKLSHFPNRNMREFTFSANVVSSLSPAGDNIARFFLRLRPHGMGHVRGLCPHAPARELSSLDLPPFTQFHAAMSARYRLRAITLRAFSGALRRTGFWATLGGRCPPKTPCQGTEFPGPSTWARTRR